MKNKSIAFNVELAHSFIRKQIKTDIDAILVLGSGLNIMGDSISNEAKIPYKEIPGFPISTAPSHKGNLLFGEIAGKQIAIMQGRLHLYEGLTPAEIVFPLRVLNALGASRLLITNAAGALNSKFQPGDVMLINDHINLTGQNPLIGPHNEKFGLRFPDMSNAYDKELQALSRRCFKRSEIKFVEGIYAGITGPSLETSAERRFLRLIGGDAVGMSTIFEVIAAKQMNLEVVGFSAITNKADGGPHQQPDEIEKIIEFATIAGRKILKILPILLEKWGPTYNNRIL